VRRRVPSHSNWTLKILALKKIWGGGGIGIQRHQFHQRNFDVKRTTGLLRMRRVSEAMKIVFTTFFENTQWLKPEY
jgi:hypothetical protein